MTDQPPPRPDDPTSRSPEPAAPGDATGREPPSEFLTPVRAFETMEPRTDEPAPGSAGPGTGSPRTAILATILVVVLVAAGIVLASTAQRGSGPPGAPRDLIASAAVCSAPECEQIQATVTLSWSPPEGEVDRYVVERDGVQLGRLPPSSRGFESGGLPIDHAYTFLVRAIGDGTTGPASEVQVRTPTPPLEQAQLTGTYRVRETVRRATNLASLEGIRDPTPGSTGRNTWSFDAVCAAQVGACPTNWFTWGPLSNRGVRYDGTFRARPANCVGGGTAPTTTEMHLVVLRAGAVGGRWIVDRFSGTMRVSFNCGGGRSEGVLRVDGRARAS